VVKINFDGDLCFTGSSDKKVNVLDAYSGELLGDFICKGATKTIDITKDSRWLYTASLNSIVECFDINTKKHVGAMVRNSKCKYMELSYSNKYLLVYYESMLKGGDAVIKIYDTDVLNNYLKLYQENSSPLPEDSCSSVYELNMKQMRLT